LLFLLNNVVTEVEVPELRLMARACMLGTDVLGLRPREAMELARRKLQACHDEGRVPDAALVHDLAALIIARTGANAALFPLHAGRLAQPRLTILPEAILETMRIRDREVCRRDFQAFWTRAA
jgi:hypothetical protein